MLVLTFFLCTVFFLILLICNILNIKDPKGFYILPKWVNTLGSSLGSTCKRNLEFTMPTAKPNMGILFSTKLPYKGHFVSIRGLLRPQMNWGCHLYYTMLNYTMHEVSFFFYIGL